ncbi:hypothetical protein [Neglectibacter timonensis]|uniref:hypothetical protein n=1 Tax=Neglectibacter timonensis TaxID=1776382 RepID=UPI0012B6406A|nr:hypothetical protein [Neglectibacter timonensis]
MEQQLDSERVKWLVHNGSLVMLPRRSDGKDEGKGKFVPSVQGPCARLYTWLLVALKQE